MGTQHTHRALSNDGNPKTGMPSYYIWIERYTSYRLRDQTYGLNIFLHENTNPGDEIYVVEGERRHFKHPKSLFEITNGANFHKDRFGDFYKNIDEARQKYKEIMFEIAPDIKK